MNFNILPIILTGLLNSSIIPITYKTTILSKNYSSFELESYKEDFLAQKNQNWRIITRYKPGTPNSIDFSIDLNSIKRLPNDYVSVKHRFLSWNWIDGTRMVLPSETGEEVLLNCSKRTFRNLNSGKDQVLIENEQENYFYGYYKVVCKGQPIPVFKDLSRDEGGLNPENCLERLGKTECAAIAWSFAICTADIGPDGKAEPEDTKRIAKDIYVGFGITEDEMIGEIMFNQEFSDSWGRRIAMQCKDRWL